MESKTLTLAAVGDLMVDREKPESIFDYSVKVLREADIAFAQLETPYSDKGSAGSSGPRGAVPHDVRNYPALPYVGLDVISLASNHTFDWGQDALLDCAKRLRKDGIAPVGAGKDIDEAREPAILERKGTRVAFLGYCSVAPSGYYAAPGKVGIAPMRAITHYEPFEEDQPGTPCIIKTYPVEEDLQDLIADIEKVRSKADIVAVSFHWGLHFQRATIADYQPIVAHAAIDAGADIIIGHHPHILKGIEVYKGKVILYSLGNFAFDEPMRPRRIGGIRPSWIEKALRVYNMPKPDPETPNYFFHPESRKTMIAKCIITDKKIQRVSFIPALVNKTNEPELLHPSDPRGQDVVQYMRDITNEANLNATYTVVGEEVVIGSK